MNNYICSFSAKVELLKSKISSFTLKNEGGMFFIIFYACVTNLNMELWEFKNLGILQMCIFFL